ncbi:uncharacterized protein LOC118825090 [Colossoma macropomum]|uniref:uncharacterized protein LOC118825090 n=1 Tax=Colossoma macropomum TaxID=42526 RepID=UPI0018656436|nr:uncharacterized protein LOC118825090 [Colossoma macropomum]
MPRTKASRRSAVARKRMADQRGGAVPAVALSDEVVPLPSPKKVRTETGPVSCSPPLRQASAPSAASLTDGVMPHPHDEKALSDGSMPFAHNTKVGNDLPFPHVEKVPEKIVPCGTDKTCNKPCDELDHSSVNAFGSNTLCHSSANAFGSNTLCHSFANAFGSNTLCHSSASTSVNAFGSISDQSFESNSDAVCGENPVTICFDRPQAQTVRGSFHQRHPRFGVNSNKQCVANSVTAIMISRVKNMLSWTTRDLDNILLKGDDLYSSIRDAGRIHDASGYLFVTDLPTEHVLHGRRFELSYSDEMFVGLFGVSEYGEMQNVYMSHDEAIKTVLTHFDACLFTVKLNTCAIVKQGSWYAVIDSHARNVHGEEDKDSGKSLVAYHANIGSLLNHVTILGLSLQAESEPFEVTGVLVTPAGASTVSDVRDDNCLSVCELPDVTKRLQGVTYERTMQEADYGSAQSFSSRSLYSDAVKRTRTDGNTERTSAVNSLVNSEGDVVLISETN